MKASDEIGANNTRDVDFEIGCCYNFALMHEMRPPPSILNVPSSRLFPPKNIFSCVVCWLLRRVGAGKAFKFPKLLKFAVESILCAIILSRYSHVR